MRGYNLCGRRTCTALRRGKGSRIYWVRRRKLFLWECMHFYWMNTQHTNIWATELLALGSWAALALLAAGGGRESRRGLLRWPWRFLPGPPRFPPDIWFLSRSSSSPHRRRWPGNIPPLGKARRRRRSGSRRLLLEGVSRHNMTHGFGALLSLHESLSYGLHGITKEAGGSYNSV